METESIRSIPVSKVAVVLAKRYWINQSLEHPKLGFSERALYRWIGEELELLADMLNIHEEFEAAKKEIETNEKD